VKKPKALLLLPTESTRYPTYVQHVVFFPAVTREKLHHTLFIEHTISSNESERHTISNFGHEIEKIAEISLSVEGACRQQPVRFHHVCGRSSSS